VLARLDQRRADDRAWFEKELAFNRNLATRANPAHVMKLVNGQPVPKNPGVDERPAMEGEQGGGAAVPQFQSLAAYALSEEALHRQIEVETKSLARLHEEDAQLTNRLVGDDAGIKGLQQRILDERAKLKEAIEEQRFVRPLLINAAVNSELVTNRQRSLESRIKELEKMGVATR
jgi:hypothetical protein